MAELSAADLKPYPSTYETSREIGDVLLGEDTARELIEASSSGNNTAVQSLLSQPQWIEKIFEEQHRIYGESHGGPGLKTARPQSNLEYASEIAAMNGHAVVVSTLLAFAKDHGVKVPDIFHKIILYRIIKNRQAAVVKAIASADPNITKIPVAHLGVLPLYEAVKTGQTDMVIALLECGADPLRLVDGEGLGSYSRMLHFAARSHTPRIMEMLLEHDAPIAGTGTLHTAASYSRLETMRILIKHGADVNESVQSTTPMHSAASKGNVEAMELLEQNGGRLDLENSDGKTAAQLLEEHRATEEHRAAEK
jgi:ankyrin repeat protein